MQRHAFPKATNCSRSHLCWWMWPQIPELSKLDGLLQAANNPNNFTQRLANPNANLTYFAFTNAALNKTLAQINITEQQFRNSPYMPVSGQRSVSLPCLQDLRPSSSCTT